MENAPKLQERHCVVEGCTARGRIRRGLCPFHYREARKTGLFPVVRQVDNRRRGGTKNRREDARCLNCGQEFGFYRSLSAGKFCSDACYRTDWRRRWKRPETFSGKGHIPWNKGKTGCYTPEALKRFAAARKGKKHTEESKRKIGLKSKGNKYGLGNHQPKSPESNEKRRQAHLGRPHPWNTGPRSNFWKGGVAEENLRIRRYFMSTKQYRDWRKAVLERDNRTCRTCGNTGPRMDADHIKMVALHPELMFDVENGQTLCPPCHRKKTGEDVKMIRAKERAEKEGREGVV